MLRKSLKLLKLRTIKLSRIKATVLINTSNANGITHQISPQKLHITLSVFLQLQIHHKRPPLDYKFTYKHL